MQDTYSEIGPVFQPPAVGPPSIAHLGLAINVRSLDGPSVSGSIATKFGGLRLHAREISIRGQIAIAPRILLPHMLLPQRYALHFFKVLTFGTACVSAFRCAAVSAARCSKATASASLRRSASLASCWNSRFDTQHARMTADSSPVS